MPTATAVVIAPIANDAFIAYQALRERCSVVLAPSVDRLPRFDSEIPDVLFIDARALSPENLNLLLDRVPATGTKFFVGLSNEKPVIDLASVSSLSFKTFHLPLTHAVATKCLEGIVPTGAERAAAQPANDETY